jgi:hypothetical protein
MRIGSNGSIPEFIAEVAEAISEAVSENQYATGCEIPEGYEPPTYNPGSYSERCGYDNTSWLQSNLLKNVAKAIGDVKPAYDPKLADLATKGNATDYLMAATGKGGTEYAGIGPMTGSFMGMTPQLSAEKLEQDLNAGKTIVMETGKDGGFMDLKASIMKQEFGLEPGQCYTVKRVYTDETGKKMVEFSDPTGQSQPRPVPVDRLGSNKIAVG